MDWAVDDEIAQCPMVVSSGAAGLAAAVNSGKRLVGGSIGGAFLINEYGQVLVPATASYDHVAVVGECSGPLEFSNMFQGGSTFDLADADGLALGNTWERPYTGIPHNLSAGSRIYFKTHPIGGMRRSFAPYQDQRLINALRTLRPSGPVRFLVTYGGIVLTKVPVGRWSVERWAPSYVRKLDYGRWYTKEF